MIRLMFFMQQFPGFGGIETVTSNLAAYLHKDMEVYVFALKKVSGMPVPEGLKGIFIPGSRKRSKITRYYNEVVRRHGITHVISQGGFSKFTKVVLNPGRDKAVKVITALHGMPGYESPEFELLPQTLAARAGRGFQWKLYGWLGVTEKVLAMKKRKYCRRFSGSFRRACVEGDRMVLLSEGYIESFIASYGVERYREKVVAIPNPCPTKYEAVVPAAKESKGNEVLYVGRLSREKNVDCLLEVWSSIGKRAGWTFSVVGDGPARQELEALVREKGIREVVFEGYSVEPERFYRRAKVLLLASDFEGFGMCLLEGERFGVVPVSFDISAGVRDAVGDGGVIVPDRNAAGMASAVQELMEREEHWEEMSRRAFEHSRKFSVDAIGEQWKRLIMSL